MKSMEEYQKKWTLFWAAASHKHQALA
jgi:hypothetical protein